MNSRSNVTKGSMWDTPKMSYSKETGALLKSLFYVGYHIIIMYDNRHYHKN